MSTGAFSESHTMRLMMYLIRAVFPSGLPAHTLLLLQTVIRKSAHVTEYFVLSLLTFRAMRHGSMDHHALRWSILTILVVVLIASADEIHQAFIPSRTSSIVDVGIDTVGGLFAQCVRVLFNAFRLRRQARLIERGPSTSE